MTNFRQGDIIMLDFQPQAGREQTSTRSNFPLNILLDEQTKTQGSILCQHVKSLDLKIRNATYIERLPEVLFKEVKEIISSQL